MKKKILICLVVQLICWSIMTLSDYMEETYNDSYNLVVVFAVPLICVILYIVFRKKDIRQSDRAAERCRHNLCGVDDLWIDTGIPDRCSGSQ